MKGLEVAWRTLCQEEVTEPCIVSSWLMKGDYYSRVTGRDYWQDKESVFLEALPRLGVNLCPQWAMPYDRAGNAGEVGTDWGNRWRISQPEQILPLIETLPSDEEIARDFDVDACATQYAGAIRQRIDATDGEVLFIDGFGQADFMGPYNDWGYSAYLLAMRLYPDHLRRYYDYTAALGYWHNVAIVEAIRRWDLAPFVYGGQDICFNDGPICGVKWLDDYYFPALRRAIQPLLEYDVRIIWHCDGNIMPILDRLVDLGVSGLQGFQEEAGVPYEQIVQVKSRWGRPMIVWGCVSVTTTLPAGTVADVQAAVRRSFTLAGRGRGFALAATSSILPDVPDENIEAFFTYGREFGRRYLRGEEE